MDLLDQCRDKAHSFYTSLFAAACSSLRDRLFEQSGQSRNNDEQRHYFEAMQQLNVSTQRMHDSFATELAARYNVFRRGDDARDDPELAIDFGQLSLVQREQLEDELAISVITSKGNSQNAEALWKLNRRLAVLRGGLKVSDETNPFGPQAVCEALQQAVHQLEIDSRARGFVYKHYGRLLLAAFGKILVELNQLLVAGKVLPNLRFVVSRGADGGAAESAAPADTAPVSADAELRERASAETTRQLYRDIQALQQRLLAQPRGATLGGVDYRGLGTDGVGGVESFAAQDYALVLTALQQAAEFASANALGAPLDIDLIEQRLIEQLKQKATPDAAHKVARNDADTVDLVGMIFRFMLEDEALPDVVKSLLSHLHTPYLKLALLDRRFLDDATHPSRRLLNSMAEVGGRWVENGDDRSVLPKLRTVVETILHHFADDPALFDDLYEDFSRFREGLEKRAAMIERRNREAQQGLEKLEQARRRAESEVQARIDKLGINETIAALLLQPWAEFLSYHLLRHGEESLSWQSALKVVDGVLWSVHPRNARGSREDFQRRVRELDGNIREGLATIGYDSKASAELLEKLAGAQALAFSSAGSAPDAPAADRQAPAAEAVERSARKPAPEVPALTAEQQRAAERLQRLDFGTWFEFDQARGKPLLLKMSWFSKMSSHYMFVNQVGVKQRVVPLNELAVEVAAGRARVVEMDGRSFMERAFEAIVKRLRKAAPA